MPLREQFGEALRSAMKAKDTKRVGTVRLIMAAVQSEGIAKKNENLSDEEVVAVLSRMVKQREDSVAAYEAGNRPEMAQAERDEIAIIREYLPKQLSPEEMRAAVQGAIAATGATSIRDMGKVMGALKANYAGALDFGKAGALVKEMLAPK